MKITAKLCRWVMYIQRYKVTLWCMIFVLTGLPVNSYASEDFSLEDFAVTKWEKMHDYDMYKHSLLDQCLRIVDHDALLFRVEERITAEECHELDALHRDGSCEIGLVPDNIRLERLTGHHKGKPSVFVNKQKALGRIDQATVCQIANGKKFVFFNVGKDKDGKKIERCFNLGVIYKSRPQMEVRSEVIMVPYSPRTYFSDAVHPSGTNQVLTTGIELNDCCCETPNGQFVGGSIVIENPSTLKSQGYSDTLQ